ncbi:lipopolysaccharide/colanic/teichoic acid biosynthesis glycosyltransferase [Rhodopseudomonas faecalis]|uniref:Lipopolysaccharide/colanic/teichoic acid biosynthesis glycosyltransferase n=1 Tax=Rhodopseudomonas faecalis TaxID=99655 RepID=A0A318TAR7_9BRAD|nr:sugar transferase [Rhodopseudomonas faecalis]PYF01693.1 lipopolysaccharide/colanic/teichoic acid biosynthesis glycosyltransferase [Rhodopseudomonas faecalis]
MPEKGCSSSKRLLDLILAIPAALVIAFPALVVAILVRIKLGSPVLFRQSRPGRGGALFTMLKFRTMTDARGPDGQLLPDSERLTSFGAWLRSTSLDELPELINVIRGEMSLVGPRPLLVEYLALYTPEQARRHEVRPGITGWAQINGRNTLDWESRLQLDTWYVDHQSLWLDIRILAATVGKVLKREGITQEGSVTMSRFRGSQDTM